MRWKPIVAGLMLISTSTAQAQGTPKMEHATGTFAVEIAMGAQGPAPEGGVPTARMGLNKTFAGGLTGTAIGTMISGGTPSLGNAAAYVAIDQFRGELAGRKGGFMLVHRGTMTRAGGGELSVIIAPDSGTGELAGIDGQLEIKVEGGVHHYDLAYTLPGK